MLFGGIRMKRKQVFTAALLCLSLLLCACGGIQTAEPVSVPAGTQPPESVHETPAPLSEEAQRAVIDSNRALWEFPTEPWGERWFYTVTDLDRNGWLEVLAASTQGTGIFTYAKFYEVQPDGKNLLNLYHKDVEVEGPDDWPEIIQDSLTCYYDAASDRYYYPCEGVTRDGAAHQYFAWYALCLKDGVAEWELLASKELEWRNGGEGPYTTCLDAQGNAISEADYDSAVERRFAGMEKTEIALSWTQIEPPREQVGSEPPTPATMFGPAPVITKNPTSETLSVGGRTWFIAHADNATRIFWLMLSPEGEYYTLEDAMALHPGLELEALEEDTLALRNVPLSLNGWAAVARFDGGGTFVVTSPAYVFVVDYVDAYADVIEKYRIAYETGNSGNEYYNEQYAWANGISPFIGYSTHVGYAVKDLDMDGTPEIIIAGIEYTNDSKEVFDIYTLAEGKAVRLAMSYFRDRYYLRSDDTLLNFGSGGAGHTLYCVMHKEGDQLVTDQTVYTFYDGDSRDGNYRDSGYSYEPGPDSVRLTNAEFQVAVTELESTITLPPLTQIA